MNIVTINTIKGPEQLDGDHYQVILEREFQAKHGPLHLFVRRCGHGSVVVHSKNAAGIELLEDVTPPTKDNVITALKAVLPEMPEAVAGDVLPRLVDEIFAAPRPEKTPLPGMPPELAKVLAKLLTTAILGAEQTKELTENLIVETPNDRGELTINMSTRGPVVIAAADWPVLGEEFFGAEKIACVCVRIRQHAQDGRLLIYGENRRLDKPGAIYAGELLEGAAAKPASALPAMAIRTVANALMAPGRDHDMMINKLTAKLPVERL